jgi:hypothetical protein
MQFLMVSTGQGCATLLFFVLDREVRNNALTRLLTHKGYSSADLWKLAKKLVHYMKSAEGVLMIDNHAKEKPYMYKNDLT